MPEPERKPAISWDCGTAFDFFASLLVIHEPADYGLRASWAAGIRSRLSAPVREFFASFVTVVSVPIDWLHELPGPKTARGALDALDRMAPEQILERWVRTGTDPDPVRDLLFDVRRRGTWGPDDRRALESLGKGGAGKGGPSGPRAQEAWLDAWANAASWGERMRAGLREYYEVFYREEERRIGPALDRSLAAARELALRLPVGELFEELSQGIGAEDFISCAELVLVPCYWCSPRIIYTGCDEAGAQACRERMIVLFGARPPEDSLIPGDAIPARLLLALEALSDPTRLSILRAIIGEPLTQAQIARRLRLRQPTISHHLKSLRIAGLVTHTSTGKAETRYGARIQQLGLTADTLRDFLGIRAGAAAEPPAAEPGADGAAG
jgi:hypothetical protein